MKFGFNTVRKYPNCAGFRESRGTLHQQMSVGEQCDKQAIDQRFLTDDAVADIGFQLLKLELGSGVSGAGFNRSDRTAILTFHS